LPAPRRCRPQGSCPSRRFWLRSRHLRSLAGTAARRDAPTLRGLVPCRSRPLESPSRAFPSRGAVPALAGLVLPCGFAFDHRRRGEVGRFASLSAVAPARSRDSPGGESRQPNRDSTASLRSLGRSGCVLAHASCDRPLPVHAGLAGKRPARPLRSLAPPGSPFSRRPNTLARARPPRSVLSWAFSPPELAPRGSGFGSSRSGRCTGRARASLSPGIQPPRVDSRDPDSDTRGLDPGIRRRARSIEPRSPPSGSDPLEPSRLQTRELRSPAPSVALRPRPAPVARAPSRRRPAPPTPLAPSLPSLSGGCPSLDLGDAVL